ncbi:MAG: hypothetical protein A2X86_04750 [Bdellovibrionales bacterium GWA2_49_15]|nr:MAG: hypothetical protein A2X86_04750 [Bdellovibrionales bacterium GWA2_49_15]
MFDDSLIGRMLNETFQDATPLPQNVQSKNSFIKILQENEISSFAIDEYEAFWRVNFHTGPIDFPINWSFVKAAKEVFVTNDVAFVSVDSDVQCLCKIFETDLLGIYKHVGKYHFFSVKKPNFILSQFLKTNAQKMVETNAPAQQGVVGKTAVAA